MAVTGAALILGVTTGLLPVTAVALGCKGTMEEVEYENETTKEIKAPFSPIEQTDELWRSDWESNPGPIEVMGSKLAILKGNEWKKNKNVKPVRMHPTRH